MNDERVGLFIIHRSSFIVHRSSFIVHRSSFIVHRFLPRSIHTMSLLSTLASELDQMAKAGTLKRELSLKSPQGAVVEVEGKGEVIMLTSNNYLGLANHP